MDHKSHNDILITLGRGHMKTNSSKQKAVTKSSCEVEILALSAMVSTVAWIRDFLQEIEGELDPPILLEGNKAAIFLVINGLTTAGRVRHVHTRNAFVNQCLAGGTIKITHCPTHQMIADILTKPLSQLMFTIHRKLFLG